MLCFDSEVDRHSLSPYHSQSFSVTMKYTKLVRFNFRSVVEFQRVKLFFIDSTNSLLDDCKATREARWLQGPKATSQCLASGEGVGHTPVI